MASKAQIKARKLFALRSKRGDFRKAISKTKKAKSNPHTMPDDPTFATKSKVIFGWDVIGKTDNFAWVQKSGKKYQVITFRKHSTPQEFAHKNMSKKEAINYAQSFNFLNK